MRPSLIARNARRFYMLVLRITNQITGEVFEFTGDLFEIIKQLDSMLIDILNIDGQYTMTMEVR